jgi:hypothetical protein
MNEEESDSARQWIPKVKEIIELKTQDKVMDIYPINRERHFVFLTENGMKYQMIFKREFFNSFGKIFNKKGVGESINKEYVEYALHIGIHNFLFIHGNKIYVCPVKEFHDYAVSNNTIRETSSGETTLSIPVLLLSRWSP